MNENSKKSIVIPLDREHRTRRSIASSYFSDSKPRQAVERFNHLLKSDPVLLSKLKEVGYKPRIRVFSKSILQVLEKNL